MQPDLFTPDRLALSEKVNILYGLWAHVFSPLKLENFTKRECFVWTLKVYCMVCEPMFSVLWSWKILQNVNALSELWRYTVWFVSPCFQSSETGSFYKTWMLCLNSEGIQYCMVYEPMFSVLWNWKLLQNVNALSEGILCIV